MPDWNKAGNALAGFGAGIQGQGPQFMQAMQEQKMQEQQKSKLAQLAQLQDPGAMLRGLADSDPSYLAQYAQYIAKQREPKLPATTGLPEGYMWQGGKAVAIPGVLQKKTPLTTEAKLRADYEAGLLDESTYKKAIAKEIAPTDKSYKQFQLQAASFADRMAKAEDILNPIEVSGADIVNEGARTAAAIPSFGLGEFIGNKMLNPDQQRYKNAASEWIRSKLRKESGAAIGDEEMEQEYRTYFPVAGDGPEVIKQKAALRKSNTESMIKQASGAYEDQYLGETPGYKPNVPTTSSNKSKVLIFDEKGNLVE